MPPAKPYTFTHGDLATVNVIVDNGRLAGIIDWEAAGFFPVWWEFVSASLAEDQADRDWKTPLRKYMADCTDAREFWLDYYALSKYPDLEQCGVDLLRKLEAEND